MKFEIPLNVCAFPFCLLFATFIVGCATVDKGAATIFATKVTTVKTQVDTALAAAASLAKTLTA